MTDDRGPQGDRGDRGDRGPQGDDGRHGISGDTGSSGDKGVSGDTGKQGVPGETGRLPILLAGVLLAVVLALTAITYIQVQRISDFNERLIDAAALTCERQNVQLAVLREFVETSNRPPAQSKDLVPIDCRAAIPERD